MSVVLQAHLSPTCLPNGLKLQLSTQSIVITPQKDQAIRSPGSMGRSKKPFAVAILKSDTNCSPIFIQLLRKCHAQAFLLCVRSSWNFPQQHLTVIHST